VFLFFNYRAKNTQNIGLF